MSIFFDSSSFDPSFRSFLRSFSLSLSPPPSPEINIGNRSLQIGPSLPNFPIDRSYLPTYQVFHIHQDHRCYTWNTHVLDNSRTSRADTDFAHKLLFASSSRFLLFYIPFKEKRDERLYIIENTRLVVYVFLRPRYTRLVTRVCFRLLRNESYAKDWKNSSFSNLRAVCSFSLSDSVSLSLFLSLSIIDF